MLYLVAGVVVILIALLRLLHVRRAARAPFAWAVFFTPAQRERFRAAVQAYFDGQSIPYTWDGDQLNVTLGEDEHCALGMGNLAQVCHHAGEAQWQTVIDEHFSNMLACQHEEAEFSRLAADFSAVKDMLMVRVVDADGYPVINPDATRTDLPGTRTTLVFDRPTTVRFVSADESAQWGISADELFAIGLRNVRQAYPAQIAPEMLPDDIPVMLISGDHFFVASNVLLLEQYPECVGPAGAIVAVPTRHIVICHPIKHQHVMKAIPYLAFITNGMFTEGPGSISPKLYWYCEGRFTEIPVHLQNKQCQVEPPAEFYQALEKLEA